MSSTLAERSATKKINSPISSTCCHCGEAIEGPQIQLEDKVFCCEGCKMVFGILDTNQLSQYYQIEDQPGISWKGRQRAQYAWLDDEEIAAKLLDFQDNNITKVTFNLPQIHCASCIWLLENLYKLNPNIVYAKVNFLKKEVYLTFDHQNISLRKVVELLALIGYAPAIQLDSLDESPKSKVVDRTFYYQLGIAGFAFGNIMFFSFPEYLGLTESHFQKWFSYLNILLALPVVFFSGRDYLLAAFRGLKQRDYNIDLPIALGILTLFGRSIFEILVHGAPGYLDSLAGLVFFLLIGKWFQQKTYYKLSFERDYKSYFPITASVRQNGKEQAIALHKLNQGDTVIVRHQELIPADGILLKGKARIDYSFVSGEAEPVSKNIGDKIFAGGRQMAEAIELTLTKKVSQSYLTQLWNEDAFKKQQPDQTSRLATRIGKGFTIAILVIAFATLFYWLPQNTALAINAFTAVLIIACPCAVALSIPFTFGNAIRLLANQGFYLKNTLTIENLAKVNALVFDKTGTLTNASDTAIRYEGIPLTNAEKIAVRSLAHHSTHPVSRQINTFFESSEVAEVSHFDEFPGEGIQGFVKDHFVEIKKTLSGTAIVINGETKGTFILQNSYRKGFESLISHLRSKFQLYLLSGDNDRERKTLSGIFPPENIYFSQSPLEKLNFIKKLQEGGKKVLMFGDGLNDAGALRQSDAGVVITENTNNFTPACDVIFDAKKFAQLPVLLAFAKGSISLIYIAYLLAFAYNVVGLSFAVQGLLSPVVAAILMPLSSITIVAFGVGASNLLAKVHFG